MMSYLLTHGFTWFEEGHPCLENFDLFLNYKETVACKLEPHCHNFENVIKESNELTEEFIDNNHEILAGEGTCSLTLTSRQSTGSKIQSDTPLKQLERMTSQKRAWKYHLFNSCAGSLRSYNRYLTNMQILSNEKPLKPLESSKNKYHENSFAHKSTLDTAASCDTYNTSFITTSALTKPKMTHTGEKPFKCVECEKCFTTNFGLKQHERIHTGEKTYKCNICGKSFSASCNLSQHKKIHTGEKSFKCELCEKCFTTNFGLKQHERIHIGEKPYKCTVCGKCFTQGGTLYKHKMIHEIDRPLFECLTCGKSFKERSRLKSHKRIHTGEKPYKCTICGKCFTEIKGLRRHERTHYDGKAYMYAVCGKSFSQSSDLMRHTRSHAGEIPSKSDPVVHGFDI